MGIFSRMGDIINSNINALLDRAEDPEKIARLIIQEMEDTLVEVRANAAKVIADKKALDRTVRELEQVQADWQDKAELAVSKGREDLARGALLAKARAADTVQALGDERAQLDASLAKINTDMARLQAKLDEARAKRKSLDARKRTAEGRRKINGHLHDPRIQDALERYEAVERRIDRVEAEAEAFEGAGTAGAGDPRASLDEAFAELKAESGIEDELAKIRAKLAGSAAGGTVGGTP